jgi:hypothetical protein
MGNKIYESNSIVEEEAIITQNKSILLLGTGER